MPRRNRVDPWGDLHAVTARGLFTGNRGCLVDDNASLVRHHQGSLWIVCLTEYQGWRSPLDGPRHWTPLFFLDEAVALAAGHRPCGLCRRQHYQSYQEAVGRARGSGAPSAKDLNRRLGAERLRPGRGLDRRTNRKLWTADIAQLPVGTVIVAGDGPPLLVGPGQLQPFDFTGWGPPRTRPAQGIVSVLTPPTSVAALANGYEPMLHSSAPAAPTRSAKQGPGPLH